MLGAGKNTVEIIIAAKDRTQAAFAKVNTQMKTMKGGAGRLGGAMNTLKGSVSNATSSLGSFGAALGPVGIAVAGVAVVMATLGGAAFKASLEFEKAVATIRVGTGATGEVLTGLESSLKTVFVSVPASTAGAATAIADLNTRLGLTGEPLEALATQFLNLSRITGTDVSASISSATRVMHDFDVSTQDQAGALDYLFKVSQSTGLGMTQLGNSMTQYGSVMRQMGFDINESAALLGKFEKEGVNLQLVLGSLRQGLAKFSKAGEEPVEALARVSAEIQSMGSVADANALAIETFGARAGPDMAAAIREGRFSIDELMTTLDASSESINQAAADTLLFGDKWTLFKNKVMVAIAPVGDAIKNVLGNAMDSLSSAFGVLQKVVGPALDFIFIKFKVLQAFFEGFAGPIITALAPLKESFDALQQKFKETSEKLSLLNDIFVIITGVAKWLGEAIGKVVAMALTPLVAKLKEGIDMLTAFYNKLGPIKGALEWLGEGVSNVADSFRETKPAIEEVTEALEELKTEGPKAAKAVAVAWALSIKSFQEGTGSWKDAIAGIEDQIKVLTEEWMTASDKRREAIDRELELLGDMRKPLDNIKKAAEENADAIISGTKKAIDKTKEFNVTIGDTKIEFKGATAEVLKNADAYAKLAKSAQTLIDLDWSVFTEFEASLPRIDEGLGDMGSSFVGFKDVLEENIDKLEDIQEAILAINEIGTPFTEKGFLEGIEAIGKFASALKTAGGAIKDFSSLQDVSIEGCINFGLHVRDMVSALQILENQMEDLVPAFGEMDSLITDIADAFLYSDNKVEDFVSEFEKEMGSAFTTIENMGLPFQDFQKIVEDAMDTGWITYWDDHYNRWRRTTVKGAEDVAHAISMAMVSSGEFISATEPFEKEWWGGLKFEDYTGKIENWGDVSLKRFSQVGRGMTDYIKKTYGINVSQEAMYELMKKPPEEQKKWLDDIMHSEAALTFQMDKQTNALKAQTGQLSKITDALQPYLEFMRTLNELAALSTLSTEALNTGLNAINDTLVNLGSALSTFDLRPVMESLFGTELIDEKGLTTFTGGATKGFMDTMVAYQTPFNNLITYVERLSSAINSLVMSFDALANISDSVLADQTKLKEVFEGIADVMTNFSAQMGGTEGFAQKFADGMDAMLKSAEPLILYFRDNNAAVIEFNNALGMFGTTITHIVDVAQKLALAMEDTADMVVISSKDMEKAMALIPAQLGEIAVFLGTDLWADIAKGISAVSFGWAEFSDTLENAKFTGFLSVISSLIKLMSGMKDIFSETEEQVVISSTAMHDALKTLPVQLGEIAVFLSGDLWGDTVKGISAVDFSWAEFSDTLEDTEFTKVISVLSDLIGLMNDLKVTFSETEEQVIVSSKEMKDALSKIPAQLGEIAIFLGTDIWGDIVNGVSAVAFSWESYAKTVDDSMPAFTSAMDTFSTLISKILGLSSALKEMRDMTVLSVRDIDEALKNIPIFLDRFVDALALNMYAIKQSLKDLDIEWAKHAEEMKATMPAYEDSTSQIGKLIGSLLSLNSALEQLAEMGTISGAEFDRGFSSLMETISNFAVSLSKNVDGLVLSLQKLRVVWVENEATLVPLMRDFMIITENFYAMANNANAMADAFRDLQKNSGSLEKGFKSLIDFINQVVKSTKEFYTAEAAEELAMYIEDVGKVIKAFVNLDRELKTAMGKIEKAISNVVKDMKGDVKSISDINNSMYINGLNTLQSYINGLIDKEPALREEMGVLANIIKGYLGVESPTKLGPLRKIEEWPRNLIQSFSTGLESQMHTLNTSFATLVPGMGAGTARGGSATLYITQNISDRETADYANQGIERILQRHVVM